MMLGPTWYSPTFEVLSSVNHVGSKPLFIVMLKTPGPTKQAILERDIDSNDK